MEKLEKIDLNDPCWLAPPAFGRLKHLAEGCMCASGKILVSGGVELTPLNLYSDETYHILYRSLGGKSAVWRQIIGVNDLNFLAADRKMNHVQACKNALELARANGVEVIGEEPDWSLIPDAP